MVKGSIFDLISNKINIFIHILVDTLYFIIFTFFDIINIFKVIPFEKNEIYFIHKKTVLNKLIEKEYSIPINADYITISKFC